MVHASCFVSDRSAECSTLCHVLSLEKVRSYKSLDTIKRRKLMGPQMISALAECTGGRPILIG